MNYIYDISLNFKNEIYDFYEWNKEDKVNFILKIPIFRVDKEFFYNIYFNDITVEKKFLNLIFNKTDVYYPNSIKKMKYASIFSDGRNAIAISFTDDGVNLYKSVLSIEENEEIIEFSKLIKPTIISFKVNQVIKNKIIYNTRKEKEQRSLADKKIKKLYKNKNFSKLKFIFFEVYEVKENNINVITSKLNNVIHNDPLKTEKILNILKLMEPNKILLKK